MLTILLSLCLGLINSARGSGIPNMKFPELGAMGLAAYTITHSWIIAFLFPFPVMFMFAYGTGELMAYLLAHTPIKVWRYWEFILVFVYSITCGIIYSLIKG